MNIIQIGILTFLVIETLNVLMLYFSPSTKYGNALGVFTAWDNAQQDEDMKEFVHYMASWVAGTKLIFILVGIVIIIWGNIQTQIAACAAMILSIASFYWKLYPAIKRMDEKGQTNPKGYSETLSWMIIAFIVGFLFVFLVGVIRYL